MKAKEHITSQVSLTPRYTSRILIAAALGSACAGQRPSEPVSPSVEVPQKNPDLATIRHDENRMDENQDSKMERKPEEKIPKCIMGLMHIEIQDVDRVPVELVRLDGIANAPCRNEEGLIEVPESAAKKRFKELNEECLQKGIRPHPHFYCKAECRSAEPPYKLEPCFSQACIPPNQEFLLKTCSAEASSNFKKECSEGKWEEVSDGSRAYCESFF